MKNSQLTAMVVALVAFSTLGIIATHPKSIRVAAPVIHDPIDATPAKQPAAAPEAPTVVGTVTETSIPSTEAPTTPRPTPLQNRASAPKSRPAVMDVPALDPDKPIARQALTYVGADPAAEQIWINSINDPNVSAHDRQDLIEDLNEEGFDDPKNLSPDDLPLIENRIALIESLAPSAMDDVNAAAFAEAYKDLINMHAKVAGQ